MMLFAVGLAWACIVTLLLLRAVRQFRAYEVVPPLDHPDRRAGPSVTVIVPARNEAVNIGSCVRGLLRQDYPEDRLELFVVDDDSTDGTGDIVRRLAGTRPVVRVVPAGPLPEGWTGKPNACWQAARKAKSDWLCFLDADTVPAPELLGSALAQADRQGIDMLSLEPFQVLGTFWERLIIPSGLFMIAFFAPDIASINDPAAEEAAANGQFILIRRRVYEAVGGHAAVAGEIAEDTALAGLVKKAGYRTCLMGAKDLIRVRMYTRLGEIWEGLSKNAVEVVKSSRAAVLTALGGLLVGWASLLVPLGAWGAFAAGSDTPLMGPGVVLAVLASLAMFCTHVAGTRYFKVPLWYGLLFPLGYTMVAAIVFNSVRTHATGKIRWKGRVYAPGTESGAVEAEPAGRAP